MVERDAARPARRRGRRPDRGSARRRVRDPPRVLVREPDRIGGYSVGIGPRHDRRPRHARAARRCSCRCRSPATSSASRCRPAATPRRSWRRCARGSPMPRWRRARPARRAAAGHPLHRPPRDLPDARRAHRAADRRRRRRAHGRELPRRQAPRTIATLKCLGAAERAGVPDLPAAGAGAGRCRHRCSAWRSACCCRSRCWLVPDGHLLPIVPELGLYPGAAAARGRRRARSPRSLFAIWPLAIAREVSPAEPVPRADRRRRGAGRRPPVPGRARRAARGLVGDRRPGRRRSRAIGAWFVLTVAVAAVLLCRPHPADAAGSPPARPARRRRAAARARQPAPARARRSPRVIMALGAGVTLLATVARARAQPAATRSTCACRSARRPCS